MHTRADIVEALGSALEHSDSEDAKNVYEDIKVEDDELEFNCERAQTTESPTREFATCSETQNMIVAEKKNSTSHRNIRVLKNLLEASLIEALQVRYDAAKEDVMNHLFNLVGKVIVEIIQQRKMNSLLMWNIESLTQSCRLMNALPLQMARDKSVITPMTAHVSVMYKRLRKNTARYRQSSKSSLKLIISLWSQQRIEKLE